MGTPLARSLTYRVLSLIIIIVLFNLCDSPSCAKGRIVQE
jgi:hypothetical protein